MTMIIRRKDSDRRGIPLREVAEGGGFVDVAKGRLYIRLVQRSDTPAGLYRCLRICTYREMGIMNFRPDAQVYPARVDIEWGLE